MREVRIEFFTHLSEVVTLQASCSLISTLRQGLSEFADLVKGEAEATLAFEWKALEKERSTLWEAYRHMQTQFRSLEGTG